MIAGKSNTGTPGKVAATNRVAGQNYNFPSLSVLNATECLGCAPLDD